MINSVNRAKRFYMSVDTDNKKNLLMAIETEFRLVENESVENYIKTLASDMGVPCGEPIEPHPGDTLCSCCRELAPPPLSVVSGHVSCKSFADNGRERSFWIQREGITVATVMLTENDAELESWLKAIVRFGAAEFNRINVKMEETTGLPVTHIVSSHSPHEPGSDPS